MKHYGLEELLLEKSDAAPAAHLAAEDANLDRLVGQSSLGSRAARELRQRTDPAHRLETWVEAHASSGEVVSVRPRTYGDARRIGEHYRRGSKPVLVDLRSINDDEAKRLLDFMAGLAFGMHGRIERIAAKVFLLVASGSERAFP